MGSPRGDAPRTDTIGRGSGRDRNMSGRLHPSLQCTLGLAVLALGATQLLGAAGQDKASAPHAQSPVVLLTSQQDHDRQMRVLKISGFPARAGRLPGGDVRRSHGDAVPDAAGSARHERRHEGHHPRAMDEAPRRDQGAVRPRGVRTRAEEHARGQMGSRQQRDRGCRWAADSAAPRRRRSATSR